MKNLLSILALVSAAAFTNEVSAFDAPPPPDPKTLQWTIELANKDLPLLIIKETPIGALLGSFGSTMEMPGFYLDVDISEVEERAGKKFPLKSKILLGWQH